MKIIRVNTAIILAVASVLHGFVSCNRSDKNGEAVTTGSAVQTTAAITTPPVFKEKDMGGNEFTFLTYNEHGADYVDNCICADSIEGVAVSPAVVDRNRETEEKFNIRITADRVHSPKTEAANRIQSGQIDFDVLYECGTETGPLALGGLLYDFDDLDNIDLSRSYWIPSAREDLNVAGKTYIATNYISMNSIGWADILYYNKTMYDKLGYTDSLYELALNGIWTFDKYVELALSAVKDVNGDGIMTSDDRYGIWGDMNECLTSLTKYAGIKNTSKNSDGSYSLNMYSESVVDIYTRFEEKLYKSNAFITYDQIWQESPDLTDFPSRFEGARFIGFGNGHVLFMPGNLHMADEFVSMQDDYGVLPCPLYNSEQTRYHHFVDASAPMFSIPAQGEDIDGTGLILEYMAYRSEELLLPEFLSTVTESKNNPDPNDKRMLDIVKNSLNYEWTKLYDLEVADSIMSKMMVSGSFKSVYNRYYSKAKAEIEGCISTLTFIGLNDVK